MELHVVITDTTIPARNATEPTHQWHGSVACVSYMSTAVHRTTSVHSEFAVQERFKCMEAFCRLAGEEARGGEKNNILR